MWYELEPLNTTKLKPKGDVMNQVMINSVDLEMLVQEIKDLKVKVAELNKLLADERGRNKVLAEEVNWLDQGMRGKNV
jgi:negative regulator of sigma E activity